MWSFLACIFTPLFTLSDYNLDSISDCTNLASNPPSAYSIIPYYRIFTWPVIVIVIFVIPEQLTMSWIISWFCFSNLYNLIQDQDQGPCLFNDNNNWFLYIVLFQLRSWASWYIITPVIGFTFNSALTVHFLHSLRSIAACRHFSGAHMPTQPQLYVCILPGPHLYCMPPGSRGAVLSKTLFLKAKVLGDGGNWTRAVSVRVERSHQYTVAPPMCV